MLATPEQLAIHDEGWDAEYAGCFCRATDGGHLVATGLRLRRECGAIGTGFSEHSGDDGDVLDVQFAFPEPLEYAVIVAAEHFVAGALRVQHAGGGERRVPNLLCASDHQAAFIRLASAIHVAVA